MCHFVGFLFFSQVFIKRQGFSGLCVLSECSWVGLRLIHGMLFPRHWSCESVPNEDMKLCHRPKSGGFFFLKEEIVGKARRDLGNSSGLQICFYVRQLNLICSVTLPLLLGFLPRLRWIVGRLRWDETWCRVPVGEANTCSSGHFQSGSATVALHDHVKKTDSSSQQGLDNDAGRTASMIRGQFLVTNVICLVKTQEVLCDTSAVAWEWLIRYCGPSCD